MAKYKFTELGFGEAKKNKKNGYSVFIKDRDGGYSLRFYKGKNGKYYMSLSIATPVNKKEKNDDEVPF